MLLHESRRPARTSSKGNIILLEDQDRSLWDRDMIEEGLTLVERAFSYKPPGPYTLQSAIAALHAEAAPPEATDWAQISRLYSRLPRINPLSIIELNCAIAIAMDKGPGSWLAADRCDPGAWGLRRLSFGALRAGGTLPEIGSYKPGKGIMGTMRFALVQQDPERRFIQRKLSELGS